MFECLTGKLPTDHTAAFRTELQDSMAHLRFNSSWTSEQSLRLIDIVCKCVSSRPSDRYQFARGLLLDLKLLQQNKADFSIGEADHAAQFHLPRDRLFGAHQNVSLLQEAYEEVTHGESSVVTVRGSSGSGKTALVRAAFCDYPSGRSLVRVKYDPAGAKPLAAIGQALSFLVAQCLSMHETELSRWRSAIQQASAFKLNYNI